MAVPHPLSAVADPTTHLKLYDYVENLKKDPNGWRLCIEGIVKGDVVNVEDQFLLLQVLEAYVSKTYAADNAGQELVKLWMSSWISRLCTGDSPPAFLSNKVAQLFALIFAADFPCRWPLFMQEVFMQRLGYPAVVIFFLRTLIAIDSEVVDREIQRPKELFDRNTQIKDAMRDLCIKDLATVWTNILKESSDLKAQELCLDVIACYVDWIDVELVVNDTMVPLILDCLKKQDTSESAVRAICAITEKGMDVEKKFSLVLALATLLQSNNSLSVFQDSDVDDVINSGSLINSLGLVYIDCHSKFEKSKNLERVSQCVRFLESLVESALNCLSHEDIYASQTVVDFLRRYLAYLKGNELSNRHFCILEQLVNTVILRYKAPEDVNLETDGENEIEFLDYRKQLRGILSSVSSLKPDILVNVLEAAVTTMCEGWENCEIAPLEAVVSLTFYLPEVLNTNFVMGKDSVSLRAKELVLKVLSSNVSRRNSLVVNRVFFELICRYEKVLVPHPEHLPSLLEAFLDKRGLSHSSPMLRTRVVYLFTRFVKAHKQALSAYMGTVLDNLAPLLAVSPLSNSFFSSDDQMYLYEATSTLILYGSMDISQKQQFMGELLSSLVSRFLSAHEQLAATSLTAEETKILKDYLASIITYCSRITKPFTDNFTMKECGFVGAFSELLNTFLEKAYLDYGPIVDALRQYLHRMVVCLGDEFLPALPAVLGKFLDASSDLKALHGFLILLQQIIARFKERLLNTQLEIRLLFEVFWSVQRSKYDTSDETVAENLRYLNRAYLQTILAMSNNKLMSLITNLGVEFMEQVLTSVLSFCICADPVAQKVALNVVSKIFLSYSFSESLWGKTVIAVLQVPLCKQHDTSDAQCMLVQHEAAACLLLLRQSSTEKFDSLLQSILPVDIAEQFRQCLISSKGKDLDQNVDEIYSVLKQRNSFS